VLFVTNKCCLWRETENGPKTKDTKMTRLPLMKLGSLLKKIDEREKGLGVGVEVRGVEKISSSL